MASCLMSFITKKLLPISVRARRGPVVETAEGPVLGKKLDKGRITFFGGVPYAKPPIGELRWRAPEAAVRRDGVVDCTSAGAMAFQRLQSMDSFIGNLVVGLGLSKPKQKAISAAVKAVPKPQTEDCLTLNIRTPTGATGLPVMFWIHGGDHTDGSGSDPFYDSNALPSRGCVVVTINYRLGLFGFLAHPELSAESPQAVSGNYGLLDQIAALEWVRNNIAAFGGDPERITIFGESAGGQAVLNLMTSPRSRGRFAAAIAQSPSDSGRWLHLDQPVLGFDSALDAGSAFATSLVGGEPGQIERLRAMEPEELSDAYRADVHAGRHFYPVVDGAILPTTPMTAFSNQAQAPVPFMVGYNADECSLLAEFVHPAGPEFGSRDDALAGAASLDRAAMRARFVESFGSEQAVDQLMAAYPGLADLDEEAIERYLADHMFGVHVDHASRQHAAVGYPTYRYHFRSVPASPKQTAGAFHAAEIFHVFDTSFPLVPDSVDGHLLTRDMGDRWFAFAATHVPDSPGRASWPLFDPAEPKHMVFDRPVSGPQLNPAEPGLALLRDRIDFINEATSKIERSTTT